MSEVKVIQPVIQPKKKLRVCAYARVSSSSDDQMNSFAAQVDYYTSYIQSNEEWEFTDIYADEGITGTSDKRGEFQRLLLDCRAGKIDRILVKSISRFARNIFDCIKTTRELKQMGVTIAFEKEGIDTGTMGSEMILSMLSVAAQEESISISQNQRWSYKRRMKSGKFITASAPFGYALEDRKLKPNKEETPIVYFIFNGYLNGMSVDEIIRELSKQYTDRIWYPSFILNLLRNEKYIGDAKVQKTYTSYQIPFQRFKNKGQKSSYYIENSHLPIIEREVFEKVQTLLKKKCKTSNDCESRSPLSRFIKCGVCGNTFRKKKVKDKNLWVCRTHDKEKEKCPVKAINEQDIHVAFYKLHNKFAANYKEILQPMLNQLQELQSAESYSNPEAKEINNKIDDLLKQNHALTRLRSKGCIDSALFLEQSSEIDSNIKKLRDTLKQYKTISPTNNILWKTKAMLSILQDADPLYEFNQDIFHGLVSKIIIDDKMIRFMMINGLMLDESREED